MAGIDSDNDGVRDDIQRWINSKYPEDKFPNTNKALKVISKYEQLTLKSVDDKEATIAAIQKNVIALNCLFWVEGINDGIAIEKQHRSMFINTPKRVKATLRADQHYQGQSEPYIVEHTPIEQRGTLCEFNAEKEK